MTAPDCRRYLIGGSKRHTSPVSSCDLNGEIDNPPIRLGASAHQAVTCAKPPTSISLLHRRFVSPSSKDAVAWDLQIIALALSIILSLDKIMQMISSVIVRFSAILTVDLYSDIIDAINRRTGMDVGELIDNRLLPLTIETNTHQEMEDTTKWLQSLKGVEFVDVVFVCFEQNLPVRAAV